MAHESCFGFYHPKFGQVPARFAFFLRERWDRNNRPSNGQKQQIPGKVDLFGRDMPGQDRSIPLKKVFLPILRWTQLRSVYRSNCSQHCERILESQKKVQTVFSKWRVVSSNEAKDGGCCGWKSGPCSFGVIG